MTHIVINDSKTCSHVAATGIAGQFTYDPDNLFDVLIKIFGLKNDAALSRTLEVAPPMISKIRHRRLQVSAFLLIRMHEVSALSIGELRGLMGDHREYFQISSVPKGS